MDFLIAVAIVIVLVGGTVLFHYEGLRFLSIGPWSMKVNPRMEMQIIILGVFVLHLVEVAAWGVGYWFGDVVTNIGDFGGRGTIEFVDYMYFSVETYTSLGYGDVYPLDDLRLLAGIECLNGLLLLGWSASFTFLQMQLYWVRHGKTGEPAEIDDDDHVELRPRRRERRRAARLRP